MEFLIEATPYIGGLIGLLVVMLLAKWGIKINKETTISGTILVINKLLEIFGGVEEIPGLKGQAKLDEAVSRAKLLLNKNELKILESLGGKANKAPEKDTFGDKVKAGVQDIFLNSVGIFAKDKLNKLIKKI